jgi:hypothetical protein
MLWKKTVMATIVFVLTVVGIQPAFSENIPNDTVDPFPETEKEASEVPPPPTRKEIRSQITSLDDNVRTIMQESKIVNEKSKEKRELEVFIQEQEARGQLEEEKNLEAEKEKLSRLQSEKQKLETDLANEKERIREVAFGLYVGGESNVVIALSDPESPEYRINQTLRVSVTSLDAQIREIKNSLEGNSARIRTQENTVAEAEVAAKLARKDLDEAIEKRNQLASEIQAAEEKITLLQNQNVVQQGTIVNSLKLVGSPAASGRDPSISIMGDPVLTSDELTAWFSKTRGSLQVGDNDVALLAKLYIEEGKNLGVRGDIAFIQAVLETGNFVYTGKNNFAGIGHCDSCVRGYPFETPQDGVRAQIQLLRSYADEEIKTKDLPGGAQPGINPDTLGVRGCCVSWWGLSGVWASALHYGGSLLKIYDEVIDFTVKNRSSLSEVLPAQ